MLNDQAGRSAHRCPDCVESLGPAVQVAQAGWHHKVALDDFPVTFMLKSITCSGSARLLVEAKQRGLIKNVKDAIIGMRNGGYRIHNDIVDFALRKAGEDQ